MTKSPKTFRLSAQAVEALSRLVEVTGTNETAIVEMALVRFSQMMTSPGPDPKPSGAVEVVSSSAVSKSRKRHKPNRS